MTLIVIDYHKGNLRSVQKSLELTGVVATISAEVEAINNAQALVLPGVGSFADASAAMLGSGQMQAVRNCIRRGVPFLGICLGMQLLFERGAEGVDGGGWAEGLGILPGQCVRIASSDEEGMRYKVPHVGWNQVFFADGRDKDELFTDIEQGSHFYFTHSYCCEPSHSPDITATVEHARCMPSAVRRDNLFGVQFHPEKSSDKGLAVMKNFVRFAVSHNPS